MHKKQGNEHQNLVFLRALRGGKFGRAVELMAGAAIAGGARTTTSAPNGTREVTTIPTGLDTKNGKLLFDLVNPAIRALYRSGVATHNQLLEFFFTL